MVPEVKPFPGTSREDYKYAAGWVRPTKAPFSILHNGECEVEWTLCRRRGNIYEHFSGVRTLMHLISRSSCMVRNSIQLLCTAKLRTSDLAPAVDPIGPFLLGPL